MFQSMLKKILGTKNERTLKKLAITVDAINEREPYYSNLSDKDLKLKTDEFKNRLSQSETLDDILIDAFAAVRESAVRTVGMRHFDVQLIGGMVLHKGMIAEMATGEGKTLAATLAAYLNALEGKGVHVVTVNDYLAQRDREWMAPVYEFLGLTVGAIQHDMDSEERREQYACDITYGTNNEFGFDYLRDNMKYDQSQFSQRGHNYAIVDEVDSILIDEARTPLIISGPAEDSTSLYYEVNKVIPFLKEGTDYEHNEEDSVANLTEEGVLRAEKLLNVDNLYDPDNMTILHHLNQALRAHVLFKKDINYMIRDGQVLIVDEFTGRIMPGRRWSDGLHQAVEAKEGVKIENENQTLASVTFQNYFRMYNKLSGMTGTAETEAVEFDKIYSLEVIVIPTNRELKRKNYPDVIYRTEREKFKAVVEEIKELNKSGKPALVGTISIENSEKLSALLKKEGIKHVVLNAKYHLKEAEIVAQAGRSGAITIATNMAGRGTDIILGGNPEFLIGDLLEAGGVNRYSADSENFIKAIKQDNIEEAEKIASKNDNLPKDVVKRAIKIRDDAAADHEKVIALGGLHILGTERHESRRIDNQLRGRSGRQGDPGSSKFYLSLEDDLLRIFAGNKISGLMEKLGMTEGVPIEHNMITRSIEKAQLKVEARNFEIRKHLLEYDDVMNKQRQAFYSLRNDVLHQKNKQDYVLELADSILEMFLDEDISSTVDPDDWTPEALESKLQQQFGLKIDLDKAVNKDLLNREEIRDLITKEIHDKYKEKEDKLGKEFMRYHERMLILNIIDNHWKDHLYSMDHLKEGISLRGYGQRDPLIEYKKESYDMFMAMQDRIEEDIVRYLFLLEPVKKQAERKEEEIKKKEKSFVYSGGDSSKAKTVRREGTKIGRNSPCPCGSGKKYKKCCEGK